MYNLFFLNESLVTHYWLMNLFMPLHEEKHRGLLFLSLAALGVVYGDIGTSPLYAINQVFFGLGKATTSFADVLGGISLVTWSLTLLIAIKYVIFVLKADNKGEGGVFALYGLLDQLKSRSKWIFIALLIIAAGLLFGDGIITPAISVISSIEGLSVVTTAFNPYIVPLTLVILTGLFLIQSKGTAKIGTLFGPIIIVWFVSIAIFGMRWVLADPQIMLALNPLYGIRFLFTHSLLDVLLTLGAVMLVITGGEAMYADMGHFGAKAIRLSWFVIVYPSLLINYWGQGAYLLSHHPVINGNIFFSMIPGYAIIPMVVVATFATIIASQALISGAFSLASQAISMGLFPFFRVVHTHQIHEGQIYVPVINWLLYVGCALLVVIFRSSNNLASAYGLAVSGVMLVTSLSMIQIAIHYWKWPTIGALCLFIPFILIDTSFLSANSLKLVEGGYIPLGIGLGILALMKTWQWGRSQVRTRYESYPAITVKELITRKKSSSELSTMDRTHIMMTPKPILKLSDKISTLGQLFIDRYEIIPKNIVFLTVKQAKIPFVGDKERFEIVPLYEDKKKGAVYSVVMQFGFMEQPDVETNLTALVNEKEIAINHDHDTWIVDILQERPIEEQVVNVFKKLRYELFMFLARNTETADVYFGLGKEKHLSSEILPIVMEK